MPSVKPLKAQRLYHHCNKNDLGFKSTDELKDLSDFLGQERAIDALSFGVGIEHKGYNLFVLGSTGTGRHTVIFRYLNKIAKTRPVPDDWAYVHNYEQDDQPLALRMPAGTGKKLHADMQQLVKDLKIGLPAAFEEEAYGKRKIDTEEKYNAIRRGRFKKIDNQASKKNIAFMETQSGFVFAPKKDGKVVSAEDFESFPKKEKEVYEKNIEVLQVKLKEMLQDMPKLRKELQNDIKQLNQETAELAVGHLFDELKKKYAKLPDVLSYFEKTRENIIDNIEDFLKVELESHEDMTPEEEERHSLRNYDVNVLVDHSKSKGAPVFYESHPTYPNLVGRIELKPMMGSYVTDFHLIKPGALHRANGGFLVIDADKLLMQPLGWESLKRIMRTRKIRIESLSQVYNMATTVTLQPATIPLDTKVILIGDRSAYYMLSQLDPEFSELFKVAVDFEDQIDASKQNIRQYSRLLATMARKESMKPLTNGAIARVIEHSHRLVDDYRKLSANVLSMADVIREADYWATKNKRKKITEKEVQQAIDFQIYRLARIRDRTYESILENTKLIDTEGSKVGQINGLSVLSIGNFAFGQPARITAAVRVGKGEVIDIEREVELGGSIHSKGVLILSQFLATHYAKDVPLSIYASIVFEQSYGLIDGDSASTAELCALLSALADVPIQQHFAVTGAVNQKGEVQAIGGVNEKIEGFFDICSQRGLTGDQGVIIPEANVKNLMLRKDVVDAVKKGKFAVYSIENVDEAIELLTGVKLKEFNKRVSRRLVEFSEIRQKLLAN